MAKSLADEVIMPHGATLSLLQLSLPGEVPLNIGVLILDPATDRLYKRLRKDWSLIAKREEVEVLKLLDRDFEAKTGEMGGEAFLRSLEDSLSNMLLITPRQDVVVSDFETALNPLFEEHVQKIDDKRTARSRLGAAGEA